jgi:hypothetical protein
MDRPSKMIGTAPIVKDEKEGPLNAISPLKVSWAERHTYPNTIFTAQICTMPGRQTRKDGMERRDEAMRHRHERIFAGPIAGLAQTNKTETNRQIAHSENII